MKAEVTEVVDYLRDPGRYHRAGARGPRGVLMAGPPGTGKTLLARAVAGEAHVPFFSVSGSGFVEMFVGLGAARVRDLFEQARTRGPAIVFIDEIDALGARRGPGGYAGSDEREQTLNQLLAEMDGFEDAGGVVVLAATNRPEALDPALRRPGRFDREVIVPLPGRGERAAILASHTRGKDLGPDADLDQVAAATPGFSGADLANLVNEAAVTAVRDGRTTLVAADFDGARDRILLGTRPSSPLAPGELATVAVHEAGDALVATLSPYADPVGRVTVLGAGQAEPSAEDTVGILRGLKDRYEVHHGVRITDSALVSAATLSDRYITARFLPDKAIDLVDEAAARLGWRSTRDPSRSTSRAAGASTRDRRDGAGQGRGRGVQGAAGEASLRVGRLPRGVVRVGQWQNEKNAIDIVRELKEQLETLRGESDRAERDGDLAKAAELRTDASRKSRRNSTPRCRKLRRAKT